MIGSGCFQLDFAWRSRYRRLLIGDSESSSAWAARGASGSLTARDRRPAARDARHAPKRWLIAQRVHHARRLLETTDLPVEDVAQHSGFGTAAAMRIHFARATATRPTAYRRTFRGRPL